MALKSNIGGSIQIQRLVKKRNKAHDQLVFNGDFPAVVEKLIDEKHDKEKHQLELASRKRLYPLEIAALKPSEVNKVLREEAIAEFSSKQKMPRRAIEQSALRQEKKSGQAAGDKYRKEKLEPLDRKLAEFQSEMLKKYPDTDTTEPSKDAVAAYERAVEEEAKKRDELAARCEQDKKQQLTRLNEKLTKKNEILQTIFTNTNERLRALGVQAGEIPEDTVMRVENVKMYFSGIKAVDDLSFDIKTGEIFGLIGPNGAGKSTLFNCITQFYRATDGKIYYRDKFENVIDLSHYKPHDVLKTGIARTFQNLEMMLGVSVLGNLLIGTHIYYRSNLIDQFLHTKKLREEEQVGRAQALEILERMQLLEYKDMLPGGLPYGVLKRVELARTLMTRPKLIILDEPAAGLNDAETDTLAEIIRQVRDDFKCTIFLVEHDMNLVMNVCDTVCAISFGKKLAIGTPEEIQNHPLVQEAYLGEKENEGM